MKWISHFFHFSLLYVVYSNFRLDSFQTNLLYFELKGCDRGMLFSFWMNLNRPHLLKSRFSGNCSVLLCCFIKNMLAIKNTKNLVPNRKFLYAKVTPKSQRFSLEFKNVSSFCNVFLFLNLFKKSGSIKYRKFYS